VLAVVLAVATPIGTALQSAIGTNVFSVRSLGASWPYLALAVGALLQAGRPVVRYTASALAIGTFAVAAVLTGGDDVTRPDYSTMAAFADEQGAAIILEGPSITPGPFTNLDVEGAIPDGEVYRLFAPAQREQPFTIADVHPDPIALGLQAIDDADGRPIAFIGNVPLNAPMLELIDRLPPGYELTGTKVVQAMFDFQVQVYALADDPAGG
jgi:hypothetical protein